MQRFPLAAKIYIWGVVAAGCSAWVYAYHLGVDVSRWPVLLTLCGVSVVAEFWQVRLFRRPNANESNSKMSLAFVPTFFALLCLGPLASMIAATVGYTVVSLCARRTYGYQALFSIAAFALSILAAGVILGPVGLAAQSPWSGFAMNLEPWQIVARQITAVFLATLIYYLINTALIATAISLSTGKKPFSTWRSNFLWTGPGYFAGASCATIAYALAADELRLLRNWGVLFVTALVATPIFFVIYYSYKIYMEKVSAHERHIEELKQSKEELKQLYKDTVESLALAIDAKDRYTREHILRVQRIAVAIAEQMGLRGDALEGIKTGALLHDIGKLGIPEQILGKPGKLSDEEFEKIKAHPAIGSMILAPVHFPWPVTPIVRHHHERWDGSGYPDGLRGEQIPLGGRILAVADVYDALTSDRSYREGWPHQKACDYITGNAGTHFDPAVVAAFALVMEHQPALHNDVTVQTAELYAPANGASCGVVEDINRASFEYISLHEISQTLSVTLNLQETLLLLANKINKIFNSATCLILLADGDHLRVEMAVGRNEPFFFHARTRVGEGMTGKAATGDRGVVGVYDRGDLLLTSAPAPWVSLQSALIVPLRSDGKVVGTINLYHEKVNAFDVEDLRVLLAISTQAGRAILNARVFEKTRQSALTDALTGLHNARYLALFLEQELHRAQSGQRALSVLVMDLDNFKPINDSFGHARGDLVLRDLGKVFASTLRSGDLITRYAGDEFVIVLPQTTAPEALVVVEKIEAAMGAYDPRVSGADLGGIRVGISIGTASFPEDATDAATLIACADAAMYRNKSRRKALQTNHDVLPTKLRLVA